MMRLVTFDRQPAGDVLDGLVEWFWSVAWDLPRGVEHDQEVINHPAGNISVGTLDDRGVPLDPAQGRVYGILENVSHRHLSAAGWTVAARTTVGGLGALLGRPARPLANTELSLADGVPGLDAQQTVDDIIGLGDNVQRIDRLRVALNQVVELRDAELVAQARIVGEIAAHAEQDRDICRVEQLASAAGMSKRTLQRLFDVHVGASPSFVIRRWRIIEAAETALDATNHGREWRGWATVAAELGYADQAHLARDFKQHLGVSPSAYVARNSVAGPNSP